MTMQRTIKALFAVGLLLVLAAPSAVAQDPGTGNSVVYVMNTHATEDCTVLASYIPTGGGPPSASIGASAPPLGVATFPASSDLPGASSWLGSLVLYSDKELATVTRLRWTGSPRHDGETAGAYTGASEGSTSLYFPYATLQVGVQHTRFSIQATDADATVTVHYIDRDGGEEVTIGDSIPAGAQATYDLSNPGGKTPDLTTTTWYASNMCGSIHCWVGSVYVESNVAVVGAATNHWRLWSSSFNGAGAGSTMLFGPSVARRRYDGRWQQFSQVACTNLVNAANNVTLTFKDPLGIAPDLVIPDTIAPLSSVGYNTKSGGFGIPSATFDPLDRFPADANTDEWVGSVVVEADDDIACIVQDYRPIPDRAVGAYNLAYEALGGVRTYLPVSYRLGDGTKLTQWLLLRVQNVTGTDATDVDIYFVDQDGATVHTELNQTVPAYSSLNFNLRQATYEADFGHNHMGGVYIQSDQRVVAVGELLKKRVWLAEYVGASFNP